MPASKKKPAARKRSPRTSLEAMRKEVVDMFVSRATRPLTKTGEAALADMFDITVKRFKRSTATKAPGLDLWTTRNGRFRTFILRETRKIADAASKRAGAGSIDKDTINQAGLTTMLATNATCQIAVSKGQLILDGGGFHGPVCSAFLEQQLT